jgi:hypothetical protein
LSFFFGLRLEGVAQDMSEGVELFNDRDDEEDGDEDGDEELTSLEALSSALREERDTEGDDEGLSRLCFSSLCPCLLSLSASCAPVRPASRKVWGV